MPFENAGTIPELDPNNPSGTDPVGEGDNHIRSIKTAVKQFYSVNYQQLLDQAYARSGNTFVSGSFEQGGTVSTATDVLLFEADGKGYAWGGALPKTVPLGSTPGSTGGISPTTWIDKSAAPFLFLQNGVGAVLRTAESKMRDIVSVTDFGALGGANDDTLAFQQAVVAGNGYVFVPQNPAGYTVNAHIDRAVGFGDVQFMGTGLVSYTDLSKQNEEYLTCANIKKRMSSGAEVTFACFGDSTMYGYIVGGASPQDQDPNNPPAVFNSTIFNLYNRPFTVINAAISGSNMHSLMTGTDVVPTTPYEKRIAPGGVAASAHVIFCNHGINNCQSDLSIDEYRHDYFEFVRITRRYGKVPVLVTPTPLLPFGDGGSTRKSREIEDYVQVVRDVARATGADLVDNYYYVMQTANRYPMATLITDEIHPDTEMYKQMGRNLAIPLVCAPVLRKQGDLAGLTGATLVDTTGGAMQKRADIRTSFGLYATRAGAMTGLTMAVIFDQPFEMISFLGLKWENGAKVLAGIWGNANQWGNFSCGQKYGDQTNTDWDTDFTVPAGCYAGLQPIYFQFDMTDTRPTNNSFVFNGLAVPKQLPSAGHYVKTFTAKDRRNYALTLNYELLFSFNMTSTSGMIAILSDKLGFATLKIEWAGQDIQVRLLSSAGVNEVTLLATNSFNGDKGFRILSLRDKVVVEMLNSETGVFSSVDIPLTEHLPPLWLTFPAIPVVISPTSVVTGPTIQGDF